jgi:hypothetical protein
MSLVVTRAWVCDRCKRTIASTNLSADPVESTGVAAFQASLRVEPAIPFQASLRVEPAIQFDDLCSKCTQRVQTLLGLITLASDDDRTSDEGEIK